VQRILIVEDTAAMAAALQDHLAHMGYATALATRAAQAMAMIAADPPDLVVLDLGLPDRDGYEVLAQLRARGLDTPVLILSARREEADKLRGFNLGADDYVTKPFSAMELLARVAALLRRAAPPEPSAPAATTLSDAELQARFALTPRQLAVARLLAEGLSNTEVAGRLGISENTARSHTEQVMKKLGTSRRARVGAILRGG
jgi:DNA-binding response OmpR family regulator